MLQVRESPADRALLERAGAGDVVAAGDLYDRYGAALYALAITVTGRQPEAEAAVVDGFRTAATTARGSDCRAWHLLARATLAACSTTDEPQAQSRRLLALTRFGAHNYREAAESLGIEPAEAARQLRAAGQSRTAFRTPDDE